MRFAEGGRTTLSTVTITPVAVETFHAASRAVDVIVWVPLERSVVWNDVEYGNEVSSVHILLPSILNCTHTTPVSSIAVAVMEIVPETVDPDNGESMFKVGATVSTVPVPQEPEVLKVRETSSSVSDPTWEIAFQRVSEIVPAGGVNVIPT